MFAEHAAGVPGSDFQVWADHDRPEVRRHGKLHDVQRPSGENQHDPSMEGGRDVVGGRRPGTRKLAGERTLEQLCAGKASLDRPVRRHRARHRAGGAAAHASRERNALVKLDGDSGCGDTGVRGHGLGRCAGSCQPEHRTGSRSGTVARRVHRDASLVARDALDDDSRLPRRPSHHDIGGALDGQAEDIEPARDVADGGGGGDAHGRRAAGRVRPGHGGVYLNTRKKARNTFWAVGVSFCLRQAFAARAKTSLRVG